MLYRKSIMEKMQSPDQLDQVQEVTGSMNALIVVGCVIIILAAAVYFIFAV